MVVGVVRFTVSGEFSLVCSCGRICVYLAIWVYLYGSVRGVLMVQCVEVGESLQFTVICMSGQVGMGWVLLGIGWL